MIKNKEIPVYYSWHVPCIDLFVAINFAKSKSDAIRLIKQGGLYINNIRIENKDYMVTEKDLINDKFVIFRKGKNNYHIMEIKELDD